MPSTEQLFNFLTQVEMELLAFVSVLLNFIQFVYFEKNSKHFVI